jgi:hypothetical protein
MLKFQVNLKNDSGILKYSNFWNNLYNIQYRYVVDQGHRIQITYLLFVFLFKIWHTIITW